MRPLLSELDWLPAHSCNGACGLAEPPGPISGPIDHYDPDELLREYRDESRWSAAIVAKQFIHPDIPEPYEAEAE
jgi:hypothetical protein